MRYVLVTPLALAIPMTFSTTSLAETASSSPSATAWWFWALMLIALKVAMMVSILGNRSKGSRNSNRKVDG